MCVLDQGFEMDIRGESLVIVFYVWWIYGYGCVRSRGNYITQEWIPCNYSTTTNIFMGVDVDFLSQGSDTYIRW